MVTKLETLLLLLGAIGVLAVLAERIKLPFPIVAVVAGFVIALFPQLPDVRFDPNLVFIIFLPPLLFSAAWNFPWDDFRSNFVPIFALAVGLVFATMTGVAFAAQWLIPGMTLASGFVLGAIVSPPDAVAAMAVLKNVRIPRRLSTVLEGESLVNDSSGLVAYQFAVAAVMTGSFSFAKAGESFLWESMGGILFGWLVGWIVSVVHRGLKDPAVEITLTILTPYIAYLPCERMGCSGVLAVVAAGLQLGHRSWEVLSPESRLQRYTIWRFIDYLLNGMVFILIGLQFPEIIAGLHAPAWQLASIATIISLLVLAIRFAWIVPLSFVQKLVFPGIHGNLTFGGQVVASWAGMRGVVSLAAALALPEMLDDKPFPHRHIILFVTFSVIFFSLIVQGLSLPWLARKLGVEEEESDLMDEAKVRLTLMEQLVEDIDQLIQKTKSEVERKTLSIWREHYIERISHMRQRIELPLVQGYELIAYESDIMPTLLRRVRESLTSMRRQGVITEDVRKRIEFDFDLEEQRIQHLLGHRTH